MHHAYLNLVDLVCHRHPVDMQWEISFTQLLTSVIGIRNSFYHSGFEFHQKNLLVRNEIHLSRCHDLRLYPVCVCNTVRLGQDTTWNRRVHGLRVYPVCVCNTVRLGQDTTWNRREHRLSVSPNWVCTMLIVSAVCIAPIWYFAESWLII